MSSCPTCCDDPCQIFTDDFARDDESFLSGEYDTTGEWYNLGISPWQIISGELVPNAAITNDLIVVLQQAIPRQFSFSVDFWMETGGQLRVEYHCVIDGVEIVLAVELEPGDGTTCGVMRLLQDGVQI